MEYRKQGKEIDINEVAITLEVESEVIEKVRKGEITHILMDIDEDNQNFVLENTDGNLVLTVDELPERFYGCYFYNDGEFPYAIKNSLSFLELNSGEEKHCLLRIINIGMEPVMRFNYNGTGKPIVEDVNGDSCVWELDFEVVPLSNEPRTYLMRWNPAISSFKQEDYRECMENMIHGMFRLNWTISEWEEARRGDQFYMMRVGDDKAGIVFCGQFISDPYPGDDWAGSNKRRMYVDMVCWGAVDEGTPPLIPLSKLQEIIPSVEWQKGHSGELLSDDVVQKLDEL